MSQTARCMRRPEVSCLQDQWREEATRYVLLLESLHQIAISSDLGNLTTGIVEKLKWILDFQRCTISLFNSDGKTYRLKTLLETRADQPRINEDAIPLERGITGQMVRSGLVCSNLDFTTTVLEPSSIADERMEGGSLASVLALSLRAYDKGLGVLTFGTIRSQGYGSVDVELASIFATHLALAIHSRNQVQELQETTKALHEEIGERMRTAAALREAHEESAFLLSSISSILIGVVEDGSVSQWNRVAEQTFGIQAVEIVGRPLAKCGIKWDSAKVFTSMADCRKVQEPTRLNDVHYLRPDGSEGFLDITISPIRGNRGGAIGILLLGMDITSRKILECRLRQAQKLEAVGQLGAGIAHEINTPVQYVSDNILFLQDAFKDLNELFGQMESLFPAAGEEWNPEGLRRLEAKVEEIELQYLRREIPKAIQQSFDGLSQVAEIVRAVKEFSQAGTREKTAIDLNKAIQNTITVTCNEWKYVAEIETELDSSLPLVPCFPKELNQVILNILVNAAHAIADTMDTKAGTKGTITIKTRRVDDWIELRIADTGAGIPEAVRDRVFEPFFTTKEVGKGTGQGLAFAHDSVVRKHGGTITVETQVGRGTTFITRLPLEPAMPGEEA